jgi:mannosylglycoprotein endo-beta-mannosidase
MISKDVTAQYVEGWDWILPVPDRNTGIWDHVELSFTGPVTLQVLMRSPDACDAWGVCFSS